VLSQQPKCQLQTQHTVETGNYITEKHNTKTRQIIGKQWWKIIIIIITTTTTTMVIIIIQFNFNPIYLFTCKFNSPQVN
jgi:hypothetical protein